MLFNLDFANNAILSCFFFFFLIIDLYFLIPAVIAQIFNPIQELVIPNGTQNKGVKAEIEILPVIVKAKLRKCLIQSCANHFCAFYLSVNFALFLQRNNFLFQLYFSI